MTLLSLASKQIWPQVLAVAHVKPERLVVLHSEDIPESKGPAQRLNLEHKRSLHRWQPLGPWKDL